MSGNAGAAGQYRSPPPSPPGPACDPCSGAQVGAPLPQGRTGCSCLPHNTALTTQSATVDNQNRLKRSVVRNVSHVISDDVT